MDRLGPEDNVNREQRERFKTVENELHPHRWRDIRLRIQYFQSVRCEETGQVADIPIAHDAYIKGEYHNMANGDRIALDWPADQEQGS